jgi:hypothetical protein
MLNPNLTQPLALLLAASTAFLTLGEVFPSPNLVVMAQSSSHGEYYVPYIESNGAFLPDWDNITFRGIPAAQEEGFLDLSALEDFLGYDPSRSWGAGDSITSILMLGDLADATNLPTSSLRDILDTVGVSSGSFSLADFGVVKNQTFSSLVGAVPRLGNFSLRNVRPLYDLVARNWGSGTAEGLGNSRLSNLASNTQIADLSLESLNLERYSLNSIPGLQNAPLEGFERWQETPIEEIPGVADLPFSEMFEDLDTPGGIFALVDIVFGEREANRVNTVTGSDVVGFDFPCQQPNCAHIELASPAQLGAFLVQGKQWISGNSQWVSGGHGCLTGTEPTGRHPFGRGFKMVLTGTNESSGLAQFAIYFRFSIFCGKSPYIIGPFPWMSHHEKDFIFLGLP